jgi:hypothetical protein
MTKTTKAPKTAKKPSRKTVDKAQFERFVETARQIGVDESPEALDRAFEKVVPRSSSKSPTPIANHKPK